MMIFLQILVERRVKPWVTKKIVEYIGEEEPTLVDFICQKVNSKTPPKSILEDISMVSPVPILPIVVQYKVSI